MLKFVFLLTVWGESGVEIHAMDTGLSGEDCIARLEWHFEHDPQFENGIPSCEVDLAGWYTAEPALTAPEHVIADGFSYGIGETITSTPRPERRPGE